VPAFWFVARRVLSLLLRQQRLPPLTPPALEIPGELNTTQEMEIEVGRLIAIPGRPGEWYVQCKHCENPGSRIQIQARDEAQAKLQLEKEKHWRESMKCKPTKFRWWACPACALHYEDKQTKTGNCAAYYGDNDTTTVRAEPAQPVRPPPPPHGAPPAHLMRPPDPPGLDASPAQSMRPPDPPDLLNLGAIEDTSVAVVGDEQLQVQVEVIDQKVEVGQIEKLKAQVEQLQVQVDELKAEVNQLKAEVGQVEKLKAQVEQLQVQVAQNAPVRAPVQARVVGVVPHVDVVGEC